MNDKKIYDLYNKYTSQSSYRYLPDINLKEIKEDGVLAYFDFNELIDKKYNLKINKNIFQYNNNYIKSILFHEFTHLYDYINLKDSIEENDLMQIMNSYSEYHASQIELLSQIYDNVF